MARILITSAIPTSTGSSTWGNLGWAASCPPISSPATSARAATRCFFLCATDEARPPAELCRRQGGQAGGGLLRRDVGGARRAWGRGFRLSFDHFGRSSSPQNHRLTQHFAGKLFDAGLNSRKCLKSRSIPSPTAASCPTATSRAPAPNCGYDKARGDQCENCTKQLDPTDLIDPRSAISGSTDLEVRETKHL